jgi:DNA-binding Lrp family transcriptional regulator
LVTEELIRNVAQWATEVGVRAAQLPSKSARATFLAEKHHEIMEEAGRSGMSERDALILAQSCVEGAERIMRELLARGKGERSSSIRVVVDGTRSD